MKRILPIVCMILLCAAPLIAEDTDNSDTPKQEQNIQYEYKMNQPGDQYIGVTLAGSFPLNFPDFGSLFTHNSQLVIGGVGTLGYHYFLTSNFAVGGDIGFGFNVTIGSHVFNYVPILATALFQPTVGKFEFPISLGIGVAPQTYISYHYFGLAVKPAVAAYYRLTPSWSLGLEASYLFMPEFAQLYNEDAHNIYGQFLNIALTARYHF